MLRPTDQQLAAIRHTGGPACILAGAGTGKTTVIATRFRQLVEHGTPPQRILVLTFSREAAEEMRVRITSGLNGGYPRLAIGTFHSFCLEHLTKAAVARGQASPTVVADGARETLLAPLLATAQPSYYTSLRAGQYLTDALTFIDRAADELITPSEYRRFLVALTDGSLPNPDGSGLPIDRDRLARLLDLVAAYERYTAELARRNALDYGSMVSRLVALWRADTAALAAVAAAFDQIMVDEFQDTNAAQFELVRMLAAGHRQLVVVGDDDQAIYAFRGASDRFIRDFRAWYPEAPLYSLTENHRSHQRILDAANLAIAPAHPNGDGRPLVSPNRPEGDAPVFVAFPGQRDEAEWIADRIALLLAEGDGKLHPRDCAVLCRSARAFTEPLVAALTRRGIPARTLTAEGRRSEVVADALAALRVVLRLAAGGVPLPAEVAAASDTAVEDGDPDLLRVLAAALSPADFQAALADAAIAGQPLWAFACATAAPTAPAQAGAVDDDDVFFDSTEIAAPAATPATPPLAALMAELAALATATPDYQVYGAVRLAARWAGAEAQRAWPALRRLSEDAAACLRTGESLAVFLAGYEPPAAVEEIADAVAILTMHGAKGRQFPVTFLAGMSDGVFPVAARLDPVFDFAPVRAWLDDGAYKPRTEGARQEAQLLEERRLFYVALTRAKDRLFLTGAARYGTLECEVSPFAHELLAASGATAATGCAARPSIADIISGAREYLLDLAAGRAGDRPAFLIQRGVAARGVLQAAPGATDLVPNPPAAPFGETLPVMNVSALETYRECPRQYFYHQCLRLPSETVAAMSFGNALHAVLALFNKHRRDHGVLPPAGALVDWWYSKLSPDGYEAKRQFTQAQARGEMYLRRYHAWEAQQEIANPGRVVKLVEKSLRFTLTADAPVPVAQDFVCRVDLLQQYRDGTYEIVDYKSGKRGSLTKTVKTSSPNSPDRSWQLGVYRLAWQAEQPARQIRTTYCFMAHGDDDFGSPVETFDARGENVIGCVHSDEALGLLRAELAQAMADIQANRFPAAPRDGRTCEYCQFGQLCEVSQHVYR